MKATDTDIGEALLFDIGDKVVYPHHGAGTVVRKEKREVLGETREYLIPRYTHVNVQEGERVRAGDPLIDGPINPHDILAVLGEKELQLPAAGRRHPAGQPDDRAIRVGGDRRNHGRRELGRDRANPLLRRRLREPPRA